MPRMNAGEDGVNHINVIRFCYAIAHKPRIMLLASSSVVYEAYIHEVLMAWQLLFLFSKRNRSPRD